MNFQELMSKASANSAIASRQSFTKSGHKHKGSGPGVSNSAVKAFLEKKQKEQKKKQADEEAAKRARIQARLQQSLQGNQEKKGSSDSTPKSSFLNPPYSHEEEEQGEKSMPVRRKRDAGAGAGSAKSSTVGMKNKDMDRTAATNDMKNKNSQRITKVKSGKAHDSMENGKKTETLKAKKKKKGAPPPPNFKELLAIAEQNKSGLKTTKSKPAAVTGKSKTEIEEKKVKRKSRGGREVNVSQTDEKNMQIKNNGKVNEKVVARAKGKQTGAQRKTSANEPNKSAKEGLKTLKRTRDSDTIGKTVLDKKLSKQLPHYARPQEPQLRLSYYSRPSRDNYYDDDGEEDSDLDGFIDDGEDEDCGEETDVSRYIKDIFGYDRRRYAMEDFDDSAMESNYNQIEREEKRSAKIAKLEDEIEILKEQAELKRMRDKLKTSQKTRK